ncbi:hypothetical protein B5E77_10210 [Lachnoclostridium sp. An131]|uniref:GNAT family N-acetyltransferase n=1 Tax=Lachnoclostridium sp. An131 TaxID=1965555 RepID=UPI000B39A254|nr:GNAT family N-acetyltransferase [Lachnoclostridium sp. An131]OUQ25843.1 hypothetical protein B5E77_10210 [Lachnoclostridium sp. An131]
MEDVQIITGSEITPSYIKQALELDRISYGEDYYLDFDKCLSYYQKNNEIYIMAVDSVKQKVLGYINFSPVTEKMFRLIKTGSVIDTVISDEDIVRYIEGNNCWAYMSSIVVHPNYRHKGLARRMLGKLENFIFSLASERSIYFYGIIADAVSAGGQKLLSNIGFKAVKRSEHDTVIMEMNFDEAPETQYNREILKIYAGGRKHSGV